MTEKIEPREMLYGKYFLFSRNKCFELMPVFCRSLDPLILVAVEYSIGRWKRLFAVVSTNKKPHVVSATAVLLISRLPLLGKYCF